MIIIIIIIMIMIIYMKIDVIEMNCEVEHIVAVWSFSLPVANLRFYYVKLPLCLINL
jgi:hypothetical protein